MRIFVVFWIILMVLFTLYEKAKKLENVRVLGFAILDLVNLT